MDRNCFVYCGKKIKKVGFLGFGKSNRGVFEYLIRHFDNLEFTFRSQNPADLTGIQTSRVLFGSSSLSEIEEDLIFLSPSARRDGKELCEAQNRGVILSSDAEFFFSKSRSDIYAVTGSDGKSTTTYLTAKLLEKNYTAAVPCGNIGDALTPHLDDTVGTAYVTELSSFNLLYMMPKSKRCVITNISENHLNWHTSFREYIEAKRNVLSNSNETVFNFDCDITKSFLRDYKPFSVISRLLTEKDLKNTVKADLYITLTDGKIIANGEKILDTEKILLKGAHNEFNFAAAIAMSYGKSDKETVLRLAKNFGGLPHRREFFGEFSGVKYYDSSIDSSPKRCAATLNSFSERVILILGGRSKGLDFTELIPTLIEKTKRIVLTGENGRDMEVILKSVPEFSNSGIPYVRIDDFFDAVEYAVRTSVPKDTVILSPAATSYDSFSDFEERGCAFKKYIKDFYLKGI